VEATDAGRRQVYCPDRRHDALDAVEETPFFRNTTLDPVVRVANEDVLVDRVFAVGDRLDVDDPPQALRPVGSGKLSERPLDLTHIRRHLAFDHDLRVGGDHEVLAPGLRRDKAERALSDSSDHLVVVLSEGGHVQAAQEECGMVADHDHDRRRLTALLELPRDLPVVTRRHVEPQLVRTLVHHAEVRDVVGARVRVAHDRCHVDVRRRIHVVVPDDWKLPEVGVGAELDHLLDRTVGRIEHNRRDATVFAPCVFEAQRKLRVGRRHAELPERTARALRRCS